ncbi:hypothetical protein CEUSTIGMA_g9146.t1 [Chlamydomonas eustigma]|uniref:Uncharacterized protein n=1 Tax=Chlamydomonas eustigma TaxID=1157962 RepID=A0A250XF53_9CHLO|nr:hypothetical protein CEUSTIGMA_g9146.t1 [Chlamydomonas eustigma]|eukprot:GAX81718.1 hypothetical protein CEUSTIGMA_g9146.t1 [Chlamydomonas eustigma]
MSLHHSLIPRSQRPSAYIKRHQASHHGMLPAGSRPSLHQLLNNDGVPKKMSAPLAVRRAIIQALAINAELRPGRAKEEAVESIQSQWKTASVGDLEAMYSILDHLVVDDSRMREALLRGPLIFIETVVPLTLTSSELDIVRWRMSTMLLSLLQSRALWASRSREVSHGIILVLICGDVP